AEIEAGIAEMRAIRETTEKQLGKEVVEMVRQSTVTILSKANGQYARFLGVLSHGSIYTVKHGLVPGDTETSAKSKGNQTQAELCIIDNKDNLIIPKAVEVAINIDLAVIRIQADESLPSAPLRSVSSLALSERVYIVGSQSRESGRLETFTDGGIYLSREQTRNLLENESMGNEEETEAGIILDYGLPFERAAGASGSPVVDADGNVVGLYCGTYFNLGIKLKSDHRTVIPQLNVVRFTGFELATSGKTQNTQ
ncbi:trypsin-like peptidase domain-containing protein, partial [candidate division WWE3 bacterium]|nr:trypsin-like peptidase domain-containing protein [candidate division WWE3 bacterium]